MLGKHTTSSTKCSDKPKKAGKAITLMTKFAKLKKIDEGMSEDIGSLFDLVAMTVVTIKNNKDKVMSSASPLSENFETKHWPAVMEDMEQLLTLMI